MELLSGQRTPATAQKQQERVSLRVLHVWESHKAMHILSKLSNHGRHIPYLSLRYQALPGRSLLLTTCSFPMYSKPARRLLRRHSIIHVITCLVLERSHVAIEFQIMQP